MSSTLKAGRQSQAGTKKFMTRGEEFMGALKGVGYKPSKHLQHEHLEYMFRDEETARVVKKLMTLKHDNCLSTEEIGRFNTLRSHQCVLYGEDLKEAVHRHSSVVELHNRHNEKLKLGNEKLHIKLSEETERRRRKAMVETVLLKIASKQGERWEYIKRLLMIVISQVREKERTCQVIARMLRSNMKRLGESTLKLRRSQKEFLDNVWKDRNSRYLCQVDGLKMLEKEDKLFQKALNVLRNHAPALMLKEAGHQSDRDALNAENIKKICLNYKNNFDRVSHCIVYERRNQVIFKILYAELEKCIERFEDCCKIGFITPFANGGFNESRQDQYTGLCGDYFHQYSSENGESVFFNDPVLQRLKELVVASLAKQFVTLTDIKAHARKKLVKFFNRMVNSLKSQKVRITLIRNLSRGEGKLYGRLINSFEDTICMSTRSKRLSQAIKQDRNFGLTFEGQIMSFVCSNCDWPNTTDILSSTNKIVQASKKIMDDIESQKWKKVEENKGELKNNLRHNMKVVELLHRVFNECWDRANERYRVIKNEQCEIKTLHERLLKLKQDSTQILAENKKTREESMKEMKLLLGRRQPQN